VAGYWTITARGAPWEQFPEASAPPSPAQLCLAVALPVLASASANAADASDSQMSVLGHATQNDPPKSGTARATPEQSQLPATKQKAKPDVLEEVIVTGSRIPLAAQERAQEVKIFTRADIDRSGQTTLTDFLNTIPDVSVASTENLFQNVVGGTSVTLHGLPVGTTLVLINGRRVESSPAQATSFSISTTFLSRQLMSLTVRNARRKCTIVQAAPLLREQLDPQAAAPAPDDGGRLLAWQARKVREYVDGHIAGTIRVAELCALIQRSEAHFSRSFKRTFGASPHAFVIQRRLELAAQYTRETDTCLSDIALRCGFTDQAHLCKHFRQATCQTPGAWRRPRGTLDMRSAAATL
jgi:AraC family transcriptional regulator